MIRIIFSFIVLFTPLSWANDISEAECAPVDMSDRFTPPRDQGNSGLCYAFAAADLLAEANGIKPPETVSALHVGTSYVSMSASDQRSAAAMISMQRETGPLFYNLSGPFPGIQAAEQILLQNKFIMSFDDKEPFERIMQGGFTELAISAIHKKGFLCLESEVPSQKMLIAATNKDQVMYIQGQMGKPLDTYTGTSPYQTAGTFNAVCKDCVGDIKSGPRSLENAILPLHSAIKDWTTLKIKDKQEQNCKNGIFPQGKVHSYFTAGPVRKNRSIQVINDLFSENKMRPFSLAYNICSIQQCPKEKPSTNTDHISVVVGRHWNKQRNRCELKIKNSWSSPCNNARPDVDCKNGYWNVGMDDILSKIHGIHWIEK